MPFCVFIAGGSCSGKTTFARALSKILARMYSVTFVMVDDYYRDVSEMPEEDLRRYNFDQPGAIDVGALVEDIKRLKRNESIRRRKYDFVTHAQLAVDGVNAPGQVVIVEGIFALCYPELNDLAGLKIYLDVDDDIRLIRRIRRDCRERGRSLESVIEQYLNSVRPMQRRHIMPSAQNADMVLKPEENGNINLENVVQKISEAIR